MKKMTCKAMGGSCDAEITGETAEELMTNGKNHVHEQAEGGDAGHQEIVDKMKSMSEEEYGKWREDFTANFNSLVDA